MSNWPHPVPIDPQEDATPEPVDFEVDFDAYLRLVYGEKPVKL